jgi:hypothetical protein
MKLAAREWAEQAGAHLQGEAQRLAPIEEGTLRASAHHEVVETPVGVEVTVSFDTVYAARQHEELGWAHPRGGQAKYLEQPLKDNLHRYEATLAAAVRKAL